MKDEFLVSAERIVNENREKIKYFLESESVLCDDELENCASSRTILRKVPEAISNIFGISDSIVQRAEFDVGREYRGVFYKTTDNISLDTIKGIMKTRYE